jgi:hypothetical protein
MRSFGSYGWLLDMTLNPLVDVAAAIGRFLCCAPCSYSWVVATAGFAIAEVLLCCCYMQPDVLFDCICNWRFAGLCP